MKSTHRYRSDEPLEIMDTRIDSKACTHMKVSFTIDARHILLAIASMTENDIKKATRNSVEKQLRRELFFNGERFYAAPIDGGEDGEHYNLSKKLEEVLPIGKELFPEFFNLPNSLKFIKDLE